MLLVWDLGISSIVLVVCLVFPIIGLLIRRQWRLAAARREEIRRLLILASEEAARAELEAVVGSGSVSISNNFHCAVCYCPTTTRCARCKSVHYCSGKCQIIHWRQGHKDECCLPSITYKSNNERCNSGLKVLEKDEANIHDDKLDAENLQHAKPVPPAIGESISSDSNTSLEYPDGNITDTKVEFLADKEEANSVAGTSVSSFSGFSSSSPCNDSSDDASFCESVSSFDLDRSEAPLDADIAVEALETTLSTKDVAPPQPLSPKFTHLVESVNDFANLNKLNQSNPGGDVGESQGRSSSLHRGGIDKHDGSVADSPVVTSGFWGRSLESVESVSDACDDSASLKSSGSGDANLSDSGSSVCFSFRSCEETSSDHTKVCDLKNNILDDAVMTVLENNNPTDKVTLPQTTCERSTNGTSSRISGLEKAKPSPSSAPSCVDPSFGARRVSTRTSALDATNALCLDSEKSKSITKNPVSTLYPLKTKEVKHFSSRGLDANIYSGAVDHSARSAKPGKIPDIETSIATALHAANSLNERNVLKTSVLKVVEQFRKPKSPNDYAAVAGSEIARRHTDKGLFPYDLFAKLYNWNKVEFQPCGLINCGNSCYANVVLQCLMFTPPLTAYLLQGFHSKACLNKEWCFTCEFEKLVFKASKGKSPLSPTGILSQLQNIGIQLGNGREEDAHEFLRFAVDTMQSIFNKEAEYDSSCAVEKEETTLVGLTFGGYLRSKIKCMKCQGKSERHERMMDLTVEIEGDISTLEEALRCFTRTEILDGENKYKCGRCKSYERAKKKLKILEAPNVLTIALKRFQSGKFGKLNKSIRFPETLDLAPYVSGRNDKSHVYRLYGVVVHLDIMNAAFSGHYVCYIKNNHNKWYKADDNTVTATEIERLLTKGAYMLFYARCSPKPPRSICNKAVASDQKSKALPSKSSGKNRISLPRSASTNPSVVGYANSTDSQASIQSFFSKFHRLQRILEEESSDCSSLFSSNSDECSCSTDSTRDSTSTDEFADFIFSDLSRGYINPSETSSSSSSSSSPFCTRHSPPAESYWYSSEKERIWGRHIECNGSDGFLHSDSSKMCSRTLVNSSSCRETDSGRLVGWANPLKDVRHAESLRKSKSERT